MRLRYTKLTKTVTKSQVHSKDPVEALFTNFTIYFISIINRKEDEKKNKRCESCTSSYGKLK